MEKALKIRLEEVKDYQQVENLTRQAFWNIHGPGCDEHYLVHVLRDSPAFISDLDFVLEVDKQIIGHIIYTKAVIRGDYHDIPIITFGPVSIAPGYQGQGYGSILIKHSLERAKQLGYSIVAIYGDPDYYNRFGFEAGENYDIYTSDGYYNPALQVLALTESALDNVSGSFIEDKAFDIDSEEANNFDKTFPKKEKVIDNPSQMRFKEIISKRVKRFK